MKVGPAWRKKLALALCVGLPLALVCSELGLRVYLWARGKPYHAQATREVLLRLQSRNRDFVPRPDIDLPISPHETANAERLIHPYLGYDIVGGIQLLDDEFAYFRGHPDPERYDIVIVGGSVAQIFGQYGERVLIDTLQADPRFAGRDIHLLKFGHGGWKQPQQLNVVCYLISLGFRFDCVINLDGFNEVALGNNNAELGTHPIFPSIPHWGHLAVGGRTDRAGLDMVVDVRSAQRDVERTLESVLGSGMYRSAILGSLALARLKGQTARFRTLVKAYEEHLLESGDRVVLAGPRFERGGQKALILATLAWMESSRTLSDVCRARDIDYLHVLQPTLHDEGSKIPSADEIKNGTITETWLEGVRRGYPMLRKAGAQLVEQGVAFVDLSTVFAGMTETLYWDNCHFDQLGNDILAAAVARELLQRVTWPR